MMNLIVPDNELGEQVEELCRTVKSYSVPLTKVIGNLFSAPQEKRMLILLRARDMQFRHEERMKILETVIMLANADKLSNDMFQLLMIAFSG